MRFTLRLKPRAEEKVKLTVDGNNFRLKQRAEKRSKTHP